MAYQFDATVSYIGAVDDVSSHSWAGTLIVTPTAIQQQWISELARHSGLSVVVYDGLKMHRENAEKEAHESRKAVRTAQN